MTPPELPNRPGGSPRRRSVPPMLVILVIAFAVLGFLQLVKWVTAVFIAIVQLAVVAAIAVIAWRFFKGPKSEL